MQTPASAAMPYYSQIPGAEGQYYNPYIQQGQQANQILGQQYGNLSQNPSGFVNSLMGGYQQSPYATYQENLMTNKINDTAAAGGYAGTGYNQGQVATEVQDISSKDMQQWLNNVFGMYRLGLMGENTLSNQGYGASRDMANVTGQNLAQQGNLAFQNQEQENEWTMDRRRNQRSAWADLFGSTGSMLDAINPFNQYNGPNGEKGTGGMFGDMGMMGSSMLMF